MNVQIVEIKDDRLDELLSILRTKAKWLIKNGKQMWNPKYLKKSIFIEKYPNSKWFVVEIMNEVIGGFVLVSEDSNFWTEKENEDSAFYIHKVVIKEGYTGKGYAKEILMWIEEYAKNSGKQYLRLDCYSKRGYLNKLYSEYGFKLKREVVVESSDNNAKLYEIILKQ